MKLLKRSLKFIRKIAGNSERGEAFASSEGYERLKESGKRLILCITVGRSGTRWLKDIFAAHANVVGSCERNAIAESFYRYVKWNKLPIDTQNIIELTKADIIDDWHSADISLVVSPYFSHDFVSLFNELKADKVIWGVNDARFTVSSFYNKGWYLDEVMRKDHNLAIGFQPAFQERLNHFFGRVVPTDPFYQEWKSLTRIGKISWFYNNVNMEIYRSTRQLSKEKLWIFKLEEADQKYDYYLKIAKGFGLRPILSKKRFLSLRQKTVKKSDNVRREWSEQEEKEFKKYTSKFRKIYKNL